MHRTDTVLTLRELTVGRHTNKQLYVAIIELSALKGVLHSITQ